MTRHLTTAACSQVAAQLIEGANSLGHDVQRLKSAIAYADQAHMGQRRKTGEPYIVHPLEVARVVQVIGRIEVDVLAAIQHDVVEDCIGVGLEDIERILGDQVAVRVGSLTKDYSLTTPHQRTADAFGRLWVALGRLGPGVALIKLVDRAHNAATSVVLSTEKLERMRCENDCMYAPLARFIGANGLARFLSSHPQVWWQANSDFVAAITAIQAPIPLN